MTLLVVVAKFLVCVVTALAAGLAIFAVMRFGDEPTGRVLSWPPRMPEHTYVSAATLRRLRDS